MNLLSSVGYILVIRYLTERFITIKTFLTYWGYNSIVLMLVHPIILMAYVYPIGFPIQRLTDMGQMIFAAGFFIVMLLLHIPIITIANRYFGWMFGKKKKDGGSYSNYFNKK